MRAAVFAGVVSVGLCGWPARAQACSCSGGHGGPETAADYHRAFVGTAVERKSTDRIDGVFSTGDPVAFVFEVKGYWGPALPAAVEVWTVAGGASCGRSFTIGETYLVYPGEKDGKLHDYLCSRTDTLARRRDDLRYLGPPGYPDDPPPDVVDYDAPPPGPWDRSRQLDPAAEPPRASPEPPAEGPPVVESPRGCSSVDPTSGWGLLLLLPLLATRLRSLTR